MGTDAAKPTMNRACSSATRAGAEQLHMSSGSPRKHLGASVCSVGDGDCGATMKRGALAFLERLDEGSFQAASPAALAAECGSAARCMGGSSGALYNILFTAAAGMPVLCCAVCRAQHAAGAGVPRAVLGKAALPSQQQAKGRKLAVL